MFALPPLAENLLGRLNRASLWQREVRVWGETLLIPSADRLLYAFLHRAGWMGSAERRFFPRVIQPGMTILDIGANIGLYALLFARLAGPKGQVYAFEPDPALSAALERARRRAGRENLHTYPLALGDAAGRQRLLRSFFNSGDNRLQAASGAASTPCAGDPEITVVRGDDQLMHVPAVDFLKIDVQGWEMHALRGLQATIARSPHLQIYSEFWPDGLRAAGSSPQEYFRFLVEAGFRIETLSAGKWHEAPSCAALEAAMNRQPFINVWARKIAGAASEICQRPEAAPASSPRETA